MSRISAPCFIIWAALAIAAVGSRNWPPSENESGVTLSIPMTSGRPAECNAGSTVGADLPAVPRALSRFGRLAMPVALRGRRGTVKDLRGLIGYLQRQYPGVFDPAFDHFFGRQHADQPPLLVGIGHSLGQVARISILQLFHGIDPGSLQ